MNFEKDAEKREAMWEKQHEFAADKIYNMRADLGGFFLPQAAWVKSLVKLCDQSPATPYTVVNIILEKELGKSVDELFERLDVEILGSASIAQVFQVKMNFEKDAEKRGAMREKQHEFAAVKIYNMRTDLGGFFLPQGINSINPFTSFPVIFAGLVAQIIGKPDLAPAAWVKRLVKMCDQSPATPYAVVNIILEKELGKSVDDLFERLDVEILGSASIAQDEEPQV
ncbi:Hypothetical predicted protein [Olea europaea subsp. europaea]|uniref:ABC1 atypical kinase-like domain-containing protein n=1 Tax=Olea europaea subsp. europaea TaxID=158383 RepID=A0A8S0VA42_OLEEU|nr:Hypothetical predicted protein [Olea europaea subsp. europaea]